MTPENDKKLVEAFPLLYRDRYGKMTETCMCWGFECDDGWFQLIWELSEKLENRIEELEKNGLCYCGHKHELNCEECRCDQHQQMHLCASQVKEKYGTARVYLNFYDEQADNFIDEAELKSETTCETCGTAGCLMTMGRWVKTLCITCAEGTNYIPLK